MDSNHRFLGVNQESLPLNHGIRLKVRRRLQAVGNVRIDPLPQACSFKCKALLAEAVGLEPTNEFHSPPVFKTGPSSSRVTSNSCGGRNRTCRLVVQSNGFLPTETTPHRAKGRAGLEPTRRCLTGTFSATEPPTRLKSALRESNPPVQLGRLAPLPLGQGHG